MSALTNPYQFVQSFRIYGGGLNIGAIVGTMVSEASGSASVYQQIRYIIQPYITLAEGSDIDTLFANMNPFPASPPSYPPLEEEDIEPVAIAVQYDGGLAFPGPDASQAEMVAFYTSPAYYDYMQRLQSSTAPYTGGVDPVFDSYVQNAADNYFANSYALGFQQMQQQAALDYQVGLREAQRQAADSGYDLTLAEIEALANGGSVTVTRSPSDPARRVSLDTANIQSGGIVVTGYRASDRPAVTLSPAPIYLASYAAVSYWQQTVPTPQNTTPGGVADPYSEENLDLGVNSEYSDEIMTASEQSGLTPHAVAAIINAEAARGAGGVWDANSANSTTSARGLTQFLDGTWIDEGNRAGSYLHGVAQGLGYLDSNGNISPQNRTAFLALRFNPQHSISAAADFAVLNLNNLRANNLITDESPAALARYAYIAHHEGPAGAINFIQGDQVVSLRQFNANVPASQRAQYLTEANGNRNQAYRNYMSDYIDQRIDVRQYMVNDVGVTVPATRTLLQQP